jgi:hypothetical protein
MRRSEFNARLSEFESVVVTACDVVAARIDDDRKRAIAAEIRDEVVAEVRERLRLEVFARSPVCSDTEN